MKKLCISIDPGFDSLKIIANDKPIKIPFNVVETDERKMSDYALRKDFLLYKSPVGTTYRVGHYARELVFENKGNVEEMMADFYTEQRFTGEYFSVGLDVAIALSIEANDMYDIQDEIDINIIVALPHSSRAKFASTVIGKAAGLHDFTLRCGSGEDKHYKFNVESEAVLTVSQTIAAILGETSDENGNIDDEKAHYLTNGPTLVLDGGYYTFGMVAVGRGGSVDEDKTDSDTNHAMKNVNIDIAEKIAEFRNNINHYDIEYLLNKDDGKIRYMADGKVQYLDLNLLRTESIKKVSDSFVQRLNKDYDNLLDFKYVIVTGGTGASFYNHMLKYYATTGVMDKDHFLLSSSKLGNKHLPIEFSIAIGAYKGLRAKVQ